MQDHFRLSYPVSSVTWDGGMIRKLPDDDINRALDVMQACGIQEVMVAGYQLEERADFDMTAETLRLGAVLASRGMRPAQHHSLSATYAPLETPQTPVVEHLRGCVDFSANLGATSMVLHTGRSLDRLDSGDAYNRRFTEACARHGRDRVIDVCAENLRAAGDHAARCGVLIALENLDRFEPLGNMADLPALVERIDSPAVGYCLDTGHAHCVGSDIRQWIDIMGEKLFTTHLHDNHGPTASVLSSTGYVSPSGIDEHLPPGFGTISWTDVIAKLRAVGYERVLNFESGPWPGLDETEGLKAAIRYWRTCEHLVLTRYGTTG